MTHHSARRGSRRALALLSGLLIVLAGCGGQAGTTTSASHAAPTATTSKTPPASSVVYVALGASDAVGVGADNPNTQGYVPIIISRLPSGPRPPLNLGISGIHLHDALTQELPQAISDQPTIITVWLVGNDFKDCAPLDQYGADLDTLLTQLKAQTHAQVFVANAPDMSLLPAIQQHLTTGACLNGLSGDQVRALALQWNTVIDASVARHGDVLVDLFQGELAAHPEYISPHDGFHPSNAGYQQLANLFWAQITAHHAVPGA